MGLIYELNLLDNNCRIDQQVVKKAVIIISNVKGRKGESKDQPVQMKWVVKGSSSNNPFFCCLSLQLDFSHRRVNEIL